MSNEAHVAHTVNKTVDGYVFRRSDGYVWYPVGEVFEDWGTSSRAAANYQSISLAESVANSSGYYEGDFPTDIVTAGQYDIQYRERQSTNPADDDTIITPLQPIYWSGTASQGEGTATKMVYTYTAGTTLTGFIFRRSDQKVWYETLSAFETWGTSSRTASDYAVSMTEAGVATGDTGYYLSAFPSGIVTEIQYDIQYRASTTILTPLQGLYWVGTDDNDAALTALANYALGKCGGGGIDLGNYRIADINDDSPTAKKMLAIWPQTRKEVLKRAWWTSATKYADLGTEIDVTRADWEYAFNLPADYLGRCQQISESYHRSTKAEYSYQYDKEIVQGRLFTNVYTNTDGDSAYIRYIADVTNVGNYDALLYEAIALKWGAEMSGVLTADGGNRRGQMLNEYDAYVLIIAKGENAMENGDDEDRGTYSALNVRTD